MVWFAETSTSVSGTMEVAIPMPFASTPLEVSDVYVMKDSKVMVSDAEMLTSVHWTPTFAKMDNV